MHATLTTEERVRKIIDEVLCVTGFPWEASLVDDLNADSLDTIELSVELENEFNVCIDDDAIDNWRTAGDVLKTVEGLL